MSNSSLINYTMLSPNYSERTLPISKITIHHAAMVGVDSKRIAQVFATKERNASCNYAIGVNGDITLVVPEEYCAWTSGTWNEPHHGNDGIAVTFEVANSAGEPDWKVSDATLESIIKLCVDICQRNNIPSLNFTGNANGNLTMHCYFQATRCPGEYLKTKFQYIADETNRRLKASVNTELYRIRLAWEDAKSQIGAYKNKDSAIKIAKENPGYSVFDSKGNYVYDGSVKEEPKKEQLYRVRKTWADVKSQLGAFKNKDSAIALAKSNPDYSVFDIDGNCVYDGSVKEEPKVEEIQPEVKEEPKTEPEVVVAVYDLDYPEKTLIINKEISRTKEDCVKAINKILSNNQDFDINIAKAFFNIAPAYAIDPMMAIAQSCLETGWFKYQGSAVKPEYHNYCGLGVTSNGIAGGIFDTIEQGVNAQLQHLFAYGCKDDLLEYEIVDPRFKYVTRGIAPYWQNLAGRWAVPGYDKNVYATPEAAMNAGNTYGQKISSICKQLENTSIAKEDIEKYFPVEEPEIPVIDPVVPEDPKEDDDLPEIDKNWLTKLIKMIIEVLFDLFRSNKDK